MADSAVAVTPGTGANIDTATQANGDHRQVVAIGDPTAATIAAVTTDNRLQVKTDYTATAAITSNAISTTSVTLVAADATNGRVHLILYNDTTQIAYVRLDATAATTTSYSFELPAGGYWESPRNFVGAATCIWPSTTGGGSMRVTVL